MAGAPEPSAAVSNAFGGSADSVIQARDIYGNVIVGGNGLTLRTPHQTPPDVSHFTDRDGYLSRIDELALGADQPTAVITLVGAAGIGKTALAVHWAHRRAERFGDGVLFINMQGYSRDPEIGADQALEAFLRAMGVSSEAIPSSLEEKSALYRSTLYGRRMLIVLDNARSADQVRPLLPGSPPCVVLITSRSRLSALSSHDGAHRVQLAPLPLAESVELLTRVIGTDRVSGEQSAAGGIALRCGNLPLALRIAAERINLRSGLSLSQLLSELSQPHRLLGGLSVGHDDLGTVRSVLSWSYRGLPADAARMFRLIGMHPGPNISVSAAAALAGVTPDEANALLEDLADAHLAEEVSQDRYQQHDLLRAFALERGTADESDEEVSKALRRILAWYLHTASAADQTITPQRRTVPLTPLTESVRPLAFDSYDSALQWCDDELPNLVAAARAALGSDPGTAWRIATALRGYFYVRKPWAEWIATNEIGLEAARDEPDPSGEAIMLNNLASAKMDMGHHAEAAGHYEQALAIRREIADRYGEGMCLQSLAIAYSKLGRADESLTILRESLAIALEVGNRYGEGLALSNLGEIYLGLQSYGDADRHLGEALRVRREIGDHWGAGITLNSQGDSFLAQRMFAASMEKYAEAFELQSAIGSKAGAARSLLGLASVLQATGDVPRAREYLVKAIAVFRELGSPMAAALADRLDELDGVQPG